MRPNSLNIASYLVVAIALHMCSPTLAQGEDGFEGKYPVRSRHHSASRALVGHRDHALSRTSRHHHHGHHHSHHGPQRPPVALPLSFPNASESPPPIADHVEARDEHEKELDCMILFEVEPYPTLLWRETLEGVQGEDSVFCNRSWDRLLCWPTTPASTLAVLPCFEELNGIKYDTTQNATRFCHANGTWAAYTDYTDCQEMAQGSVPIYGGGVELATTLYLSGYAISLAALAAAISIFIYFKDLRCLRNTIHTNLMSTYMLADFMWIMTFALQISAHSNTTSCVILLVLLHYFHLTNFFWMFVEGLYLYMLVVETFTVENIKLRVYVIIGWGVPMVVVATWVMAKSFAPVPDSQVSSVYSTADSLMPHCPWMSPHSFDWIHQAPVIGLLCVNAVFLVMIMWVLITKLRSANNAETQQYRKATKALLVLIPLLGITYILVIAGPTHGLSARVYASIRALLLSTQGFTVALFYCFLNTEVQNTMRHHVERWKTARSVGSRRLYSQPNVGGLGAGGGFGGGSHYRKRESSASEATMTTYVGVTNFNNGCGGGSISLECRPTTSVSGGSSFSAAAGQTACSVTTPFLSKENAV
ncbi:diuretic hormone receptor-like isoform X2 [Ischnura elegans]|uniref:diuretic hormone receptor-like isoform X2 n=1 Tax=Ischnura elegans TaxID=197161 RepID=UPI001ED88994|nr:diuretic hormone receptor-like isoform X2 [Ischnura elegans]